MATKKLDFTKIALIGGGLYLGSKLLTKDPETVQAFSAASMGVGNVSDIEALKTLIKTDPQIRALLKGDTGAAGVDGVDGEDGLPGDAIINFHRSLIVNGAGELGNATNWSNATFDPTIYEGFPCIKVDNANAQNSELVRLNKDRLLKVSGNVKKIAGSDASLTIYPYDFSGTLINRGDDASPNIILGTLTDANFTAFEFFNKGVAATTTGLKSETFGVRIRIASSAGTVLVNQLAVKEVELSEPVPYTLTWLPSGQMVYDPATGDVGRYDGIAVTWFATV